MIWLLSVLIILSDGSASGKVYYTDDPAYNSEESCIAAGKEVMKLLLEQQTDKDAKGYSFCQEVKIEDLEKGAGKAKASEKPQT